MPKNSNRFAALNYVLRVELIDFEPVIWRVFSVPASITLPQLHLVLQAVMGWTNSHLHSFHCGIYSYQARDPDYRMDELDNALNEHGIRLSNLINHVKQAFVYEYDFGDCWEHQITLEGMELPDLSAPVACLAGKNACPPEDCGGVSGYADFLNILKDPSHEEYEQMRNWSGGSFDPMYFDMTDVNLALQKIKIKVPAKKAKVSPESSVH